MGSWARLGLLVTCSNHLPMTQQHPMVPPNILLNNWESDWFNERENVDVLLIQAYQAGADAELDACVKWLEAEDSFLGGELRAERRPTPQSLKEQALEDLEILIADLANHSMGFKATNIRRALEQLPDHE